MEEYLGLEGGPPMFKQDFSCPALLMSLNKVYHIRGYHPLWRTFPGASALFIKGTGLIRVRSPLLAESRLMSFPPGTKMFQFPGFALHNYVFIMQYHICGGFPHSEICGS